MPKGKKREAIPSSPKVSPASVDAPPAPSKKAGVAQLGERAGTKVRGEVAGSTPAASPTIPEELETLWDEKVAAAFGKLNPKQQDFVLVYIRKGNAAEAYRKSYNPLADSHLATVCGNGILSNPVIGDILAKLTEQKTADLLLTIKTFRDMAEAVKPNWVQDKNGQWENTGEEPDWKARNDAAKGLAMLRGLNQPTEVKHSGEITSKVVQINLPTRKPAP